MKRNILLAVLVVLAVSGYSFYASFPPEYADSGYTIVPVNYTHTNTLPMDNGVTYGRTPWSGAHRDSRNSDYIPLPSPDAMKRTWTGIAKGTFFMPPTLGAEGNIYATSGAGPGHSHLHAYDHAGNLLWKSAPMESADDLDSAAFFSAPAVDVDNNIFVPDANQLWSYDNAGNVRWVTDLEALGISGYVFSTWFSHTGHAGIISSDGKVALLDRTACMREPG